MGPQYRGEEGGRGEPGLRDAGAARRGALARLMFNDFLLASGDTQAGIYKGLEAFRWVLFRRGLEAPEG